MRTDQFDDQLIHVALVPNGSTSQTSPSLPREAQTSHNFLDVLDLLFRKLSPRSVHVKGLALQQILMDILRSPFNVLLPLLFLLVRRHRVRGKLFCLGLHRLVRSLQLLRLKVLLLLLLSLEFFELFLDYRHVRFDGALPLSLLLLGWAHHVAQWWYCRVANRVESACCSVLGWPRKLVL